MGKEKPELEVKKWLKMKWELEDLYWTNINNYSISMVKKAQSNYS